MVAVRRVYLYLLTLAGLTMLAFGAGNLGRLLVEMLLDTAAPDVSMRYVREEAARWAALALVGLPAWTLHWWWAQRSAAANAVERTSALRRLYLYLSLAGATIAIASSAGLVLRDVLNLLTGTGRALLGDLLGPILPALVAATVWVFHWRMAATDRTQVGEHGASATLRRWYVYGVAFGGYLLLLAGSRTLLETLWRFLAAPESGGAAGVLTAGAPAALVGLALWLAHWRWAPRSLGVKALEQDLHATLRSVYLFLALAVAVAVTLGGASQLLYYLLARLLGEAEPGGVAGSPLYAAAGPGSAALVYGTAWAYQRSAIRRQAEAFEAPRQAGVRRLYTYLVALLALVALALGVGGLLWTLGDWVTSAPATASTGWWRDRVALFVTATLVGLPVWLAHWGVHASAAGDEAASLARRLYEYLALIGSMLALLGSAAGALYQLLNLALGETDLVTLTTDLLHALAVAAVAAVVAVYHWRALRVDAARAPTGVPALADSSSAGVVAAPAPANGAASPPELTVRLRAADAPTLMSALELLRERGVQVERVDA